MADSAGLRTIGVLGILLRAKRMGLVAAVAPLVVALRTSGRFHVSDEIVREVTRRANE